MHLSDLEYVRHLGQLYERVLSMCKDSDYVINQPQMDKFVEVLNFFKEEALRLEGDVGPINLVPREEHGGITATFLVFSLNGEQQVQKFCDVIRYCSAFGFEALPSGDVSVDVTVPNVFVKRAH